MVSAGIEYAESIALCGKVKRYLLNNGIGVVFKIDSNNTAYRGCGLIHQSAGLAEEYVFGVLTYLCYLNGAAFSVPEQLV